LVDRPPPAPVVDQTVAAIQGRIVAVRLGVTIVGGLFALLSVFALDFFTLNPAGARETVDLDAIADRIGAGQDFGSSVELYVRYLRWVIPAVAIGAIVTTPGLRVGGRRMSPAAPAIVALPAFLLVVEHLGAMFLVADIRGPGPDTAPVGAVVEREPGAYLGLIGHVCLFAALFIDPLAQRRRPAPGDRAHGRSSPAG
jgi:hypothetical protein